MDPSGQTYVPLPSRTFLFISHSPEYFAPFSIIVSGLSSRLPSLASNFGSL